MLISYTNQSAKWGKQEEKSEATTAYEIEKLDGDFKFTEGPAVDAERNVYFTDILNHLILKWPTSAQLDTFSPNSEHHNSWIYRLQLDAKAVLNKLGGRK